MYIIENDIRIKRKIITNIKYVSVKIFSNQKEKKNKKGARCV